MTDPQNPGEPTPPTPETPGAPQQPPAAPQPPTPPQQPPAQGQHPGAYPPPGYGQQPGAYPPPAYGQQQPGAYPPPAYGQQQPGYGHPGYAPLLTQEQDRTWAMWAHIGGIVGFLPSLIIWLTFKDRGPLTDREGKEALNWQITAAILMAGSYILMALAGFIVWFLAPLFWLLPIAIVVLNIIFSIMGGVKVANEGGGYRYPINFRLIK
jgi:uncharacterized protein